MDKLLWALWLIAAFVTITSSFLAGGMPPGRRHQRYARSLIVVAQAALLLLGALTALVIGRMI